MNKRKSESAAMSISNTYRQLMNGDSNHSS